MEGDFTLSYHFFAARDSRNHLELFLDTDGTAPLQTWRWHRGIHKRAGKILQFHTAPEHRRVYLTFSGRVSGDRGRLRIVRCGRFNDCRRRQGNTVRVTL